MQMTRDSATFQWEPPSQDGGSKITGYIIERREEGKKSWMYVGRNDADNLSFSATGLTENMDYYFRVYAENKYGRSDALQSEIPIIPKRVFGKYKMLFYSFELFCLKSYSFRWWYFHFFKFFIFIIYIYDILYFFKMTKFVKKIINKSFSYQL